MKHSALISVTAALLVILSGCQHFTPLHPNTNQRTFTASTYYGKEMPSAFLANKHSHHEDNGQDIRGFSIGQRHWGF